jgi:ubiquinone/menaquinone biosynthesis C-methylase UbiE
MENYLKSCKTEFWNEVFTTELDYILNELTGAKDILSVGCGPAIIETGLSEHGFNVTGLDISEEVLDMAPDRVRAVVSSAENMDFASQSFDAVIYVVSIQFIEKYKEAIEQSAHVLRSGGKILMMLLNPESGFFRERTRNPSSYVNKIRHRNLQEIEAEVAKYFSVRTEYFLGIEGTRVFQSRDSHCASLYIIKGIKKGSDNCNRQFQEVKRCRI